VSQRLGRVRLAGGRWQDPAHAHGGSPKLGVQLWLSPAFLLCAREGAPGARCPVEHPFAPKSLGGSGWWARRGLCRATPPLCGSPCTRVGAGTLGWPPQLPEESLGDACSAAPSAKLQSEGMLGSVVTRFVKPGAQSPAPRLSGGSMKNPEHPEGPQWGLTTVVPQPASRGAGLAGRCPAAIRVLSTVICLALLTTLLFPSLLTSGHMCSVTALAAAAPRCLQTMCAPLVGGDE